MKKLLSLIFALIALVACLALSSCVHDHTWSEGKIVKEPTCTEDGQLMQACPCGVEDYVTLKATGHTEGNAATCTDAQKCLTCVEVLAEATGHTEGDAPTCTEAQKCLTCGEILAEATGHTEGDWIVDAEPTCTEDGQKHQVCSVCNDTIKTEAIAATGHYEIADEAVKATCEKTGLSEGSHCSVCGEITLRQEVIDALGHDYVTDAAVAPTCSAYGWTEGSHCSRCTDVKVAQERIEKLEHTPVTDEAKAATCTETGLTEGSHCSVCRAVIVSQRVVQAKGHDFNKKTNRCNVCEAQEYSVEITNQEEYEALKNEKEIVFYLDKYVTGELSAKELYYSIGKDTEYIRFVGNTEHAYWFFIVVEKRSTPLRIDFVDVSLHSKSSIVKSTSEVDIEIGLYGDRCWLYVDKANDGESASLLHPWPDDGANGADAIHVAGKLTLTIEAKYCGIIGGDGGNGGNAADSWGHDASDGADGGDGGYALYAKEIYVSIAKGVDCEKVAIDAGWGGNGGKGGHADGMFGGDSWLYDDGDPGESGSTPNDTNVEIIYQ